MRRLRRLALAAALAASSLSPVAARAESLPSPETMEAAQ
jgi:hypothetical protein